ncbi:MAG TPA: Trp biosynthesis-associated membrane protein [Nocardioides sp.]|nr:Trp biosynthesis-associated membrane protein [Nocardioides sp.]
MAEPGGGRRFFVPVVLLGLGAGTLAAVAGNKPWAQGSGSRASQFSALSLSGDSAEMPAAGALALVVLACWGVVLVTRGRVRRAVVGLALLASIGIVVAVVVGASSVPVGLRASYADVGLTRVDVTMTGWFWASGVAALLSLVATGLAARWVPGWPEMGSRYDAPGADEPAPTVAPEEQSSLDLWRAMDEGRDPTA